MHRRCRSGEDGVSDDGVNWRPMFGLGFTRVAEPAPGSLLAVDDEAETGADGFALTAEEAACPEAAAKRAVWESVYSWMRGEGPAPAAAAVTPEEEVGRLAGLVEHSESETQRVGSAYTLGAVSKHQRGDGAGAVALATLVQCMVSPLERVRRAATWGIGLAGDSAVPPLLGLLAAPHKLEPSPQLSPLTQQEVRTNAAHALGEAAETATAAVAEALAAAVTRSAALLQGRLDALPTAERQHLTDSHARGARGWDGDMYSVQLEVESDTHELRKTMAAAALAAGLVGCKAMRGQPPADVAVRLVSLLQRLQEYPDPAAIFPTHLPAGVVRSHAERGLCAMLAPPEAGGAAAVPAERETGGGQGLAVLAEAKLRAAGAPNVVQRRVLQHLSSEASTAVPVGTPWTVA